MLDEDDDDDYEDLDDDEDDEVATSTVDGETRGREERIAA